MLSGLTSLDLLVIATAIALGGLAKGITGIGMPLVAVPIMAEFLGVERSVIIMAIPATLTNVWLVWRQRNDGNQVREMPWLLLFGCIGVFAGTWVLYLASERSLMVVLGLWIAIYLFLRFVNPARGLSIHVRRWAAPFVGILAGVFQGALGISAPVVATYLHALRLTPGAFVFAVTLPFATLGFVQCVAYTCVGLFTKQLLLASFFALLPALIAIPLGARIRLSIDQHRFDHLILLMLAIMGVRLFYKAGLISF
jgi:uncharacterized membrane protein YfcA